MAHTQSKALRATLVRNAELFSKFLSCLAVVPGSALLTVFLPCIRILLLEQTLPGRPCRNHMPKLFVQILRGPRGGARCHVEVCREIQRDRKVHLDSFRA
eukprot:1997076-Amphidinium_carterae.1